MLVPDIEGCPVKAAVAGSPLLSMQVALTCPWCRISCFVQPQDVKQGRMGWLRQGRRAYVWPGAPRQSVTRGEAAGVLEPMRWGIATLSFRPGRLPLRNSRSRECLHD